MGMGLLVLYRLRRGGRWSPGEGGSGGEKPLEVMGMGLLVLYKLRLRSSTDSDSGSSPLPPCFSTPPCSKPRSPIVSTGPSEQHPFWSKPTA
eukprot:950070-Prorocentrum_minimum.AAC.1